MRKNEIHIPCEREEWKALLWRSWFNLDWRRDRGLLQKKGHHFFLPRWDSDLLNFSDSKLRWMRWFTPADLIYLGFNWWIINETFSLMNRKSTNIHWKGCKIIFPLCCADKSARQDKCITATLLYGCHKMLHRRIWNLPNPRTSGGTVRGWGRLMVLRLALFHSSLFLFCSYPHSSAEDFSH